MRDMEHYERLRRSRIAADYPTASMAARALGIPAPTYLSHENGSRDFRRDPDLVQKYANHFRVPVDWLVYEKGPVPPTIPRHVMNPLEEEPRIAPRSAQRGDLEQSVLFVPQFSWVSAGKMAESEIVDEPERWLPIAGLGRGDFFATVVRGSSMDRLSPEGSVIVVDRSITDLQNGKPYLFLVRGETTYKLWNERLHALMPHSTMPHEPIPVDENGAGFSVVGRVRRSMLDL